MKQPKNLLHSPKTTRNTRKIANKLMIVASVEINLQSKHDLIRHVAKVKAATSAHSMADVTPFFSVFIISLGIQRFDKTKRKYILPTKKKTISVKLSMYLCFNSFWRKNITRCVTQSLAERRSASGHRQKIKNKPWVNLEPCLAHGRAVKKTKNK